MATKHKKVAQMDVYKEEKTTSFGEVCGIIFVAFIVLCLIAA